MNPSSYQDNQHERAAVNRFKRLVEELEQVESGEAEKEIVQNATAGVVRASTMKDPAVAIAAAQDEDTDTPRFYDLEESFERKLPGLSLEDYDNSTSPVKEIEITFYHEMDLDDNSTAVQTADVEGILNYLEEQKQDDRRNLAMSTNSSRRQLTTEKQSSRKVDVDGIIFYDGSTKNSINSNEDTSNGSSYVSKRRTLKLLIGMALLALGMVLVFSILLWKRNDKADPVGSTTNTNNDSTANSTAEDTLDNSNGDSPVAAPSPAPTTTGSLQFFLEPSCRLTDTELTAIVNVRVNGTTSGLSAREMQRIGLATAVETSYRSAAVLACDRPYYRFAHSVLLSLPTNDSITDTIRVQFTLVARIDDQGQGPETAFDWTTKQTSTRRHLNEKIEVEQQPRHVASSLSTPPCLLQSVLDGPWQVQCGSDSSSSCACPRDGCYCSSGDEGGPSHQVFRDLLNEYITNNQVLIGNLGFVVALEEEQ